MDTPQPQNVPAVVSKADQSHCPLCLGKWSMFEEPGKLGKVYFFCLKDDISIWVRDALLGKYFHIESEPCAVCGTMMRLFCRSDEYIKMKCPKCGCAIENVDNTKHAMLMKQEEQKGLRKTFKAIDETPKGIIE